jgi:Glycosyltransferases involved in cell wall biogenesis
MIACTPIISVIVPIYNIESFLPECIESILKQTFSGIELLLIDDGSNDRSGLICDEYAKNDKRIIVFHQKNKGVSEARNLGIKKSRGKYVCFIDGDDYLEKDMLELLLSQFDSDNVQLAICGFQCKDENGNLLYKTETGNKFILDQDSAICSLFNDKKYRYQGYIWNKLFLKEIISKYNINFNPQIYFNEDRLFCFEYIKNCEKVSYSTSIEYNHIFYQNSAMSSIQNRNSFNKKYITDLDAFETMRESINAYSKDNQSFFWHRYIESALKIHSLISECKYIDSKLSKQLKLIVIKGLSYNYIRHFGIKLYIKNLLFVINPSIFNQLIKITKKRTFFKRAL